MPEIVDHGETGFIVASEDEAVAALNQLHLIDRHQVRDVFEGRFTAAVMARNYLQLYWRLDACTSLQSRTRSHRVGSTVSIADCETRGPEINIV